MRIRTLLVGAALVAGALVVVGSHQAAAAPKNCSTYTSVPTAGGTLSLGLDQHLGTSAPATGVRLDVCLDWRPPGNLGLGDSYGAGAGGEAFYIQSQYYPGGSALALTVRESDCIPGCGMLVGRVFVSPYACPGGRPQVDVILLGTTHISRCV